MVTAQFLICCLFSGGQKSVVRHHKNASIIIPIAEIEVKPREPSNLAAKW